MAKRFINYDYDDAASLVGPHVPQAVPLTVNASNRRPTTALTATLFYDGDHWQSSRGFIGQLPPVGLTGHAAMLADIRAGFVSENVIKEVVKTHVGGILGREPSWSFLKDESKPSAENRDAETGDTLTPWWNKRQALRDLQKTVTILLCEGRAIRRLFFPLGRIPPSGRLTATTLGAALDFIYFQTTTADHAGVFTDDETQADIGIWLFEERDADDNVLGQAAELSFLDDAGRTICRVVRDNGRGTTDYGPYELGGHLLVYELSRDALITEQVQSNQRVLNLAHTMMMRNVNLAGHRERTITNAQPPLPKSDKPTITTAGNTVVQGTPATQRFPGTFKTGAGAVNFVMGWPIWDETGQKIVGYTNPNVSVSDPVPVITFQDTINTEKQAIYSQCHQRHVMIVDKADTSGRAREVARREYERSLKETKAVIDACGRWQLETALRLAAQVAGATTRYSKLRADFNTLLDAGDPDPEKQKVAMEMRKPGGPRLQPIISDETARGLCGIEDPAAELARIETEAAAKPAEPTPLPTGVEDADSTEVAGALN
jgi:hypothetical protein